jgi:ATP-binding cassette subfamily B protein
MYWPLGLVVAAASVPIVTLSNRFERRYVLISRQVQDQQGDLATVIEEGAVGIRVIKSFGRRHHVYDNFDEGACNVYRTSMEKVRVSAWFWTVLGFVPNVTLAFVLLLGALAVGQGALSLGTLVAFTTLTLQLVWPIASLGHILAMAQESMTAADRVMEVLDTEPAISGGTKKVKRAAGHLRFEGVGFRFPDGDTDVLRKVWLEVEPGETLAVVGATGSGKTTLTGLVPRLYDVTAGRVTIDGHDIRDLTLPELRSIVATAFEEPTLFSMSVRENLTLGRTDATDDEIAGALEVAQATFVYNLPWGLDTRIGEQGMSLSGGQRQRLALARAVLTRPKVLVLDDTLSALDVETEALVEEALRTVLESATGIVVAHRASTVLLADKVALLQDGTVTHVGTHHDLLESVPEYRELLGQDADLDAEEVLS